MHARCQRRWRSYPDSTNVDDLRRIRLLLGHLSIRTAMALNAG
jgi:hypothetical protein